MTCSNCEKLAAIIDKLTDIPTPRTRSAASTPLNPHVQAFVGANILWNPAARTPVADIYSRYKRWCHENHYSPLTRHGFGMALSRLDIPTVRGTAGVRLRVGVQLA